MQRFTKIELAWIIGALENQVTELHQALEQEGVTGISSAMLHLKLEQMESITDRLKKAAEDGNKRIGINY